jgi:hypothetical protein
MKTPIAEYNILIKPIVTTIGAKLAETAGKKATQYLINP